MPPSPAGEKLEKGIFTRLARFSLVFSGIGNGHQQSLHLTMEMFFTNICKCKKWHAKHVKQGKKKYQ